MPAKEKPRARLVDIEPYEIGIVKRAANKRRFLVVKEDNMIDLGKILRAQDDLKKLVDVTKSGDIDPRAVPKLKDAATAVVDQILDAVGVAPAVDPKVPSALSKIEDGLKALVDRQDTFDFSSIQEIEALQSAVHSLMEQLTGPKDLEVSPFEGSALGDMDPGLDLPAETNAEGDKQDAASDAQGADGAQAAASEGAGEGESKSEGESKVDAKAPEADTAATADGDGDSGGTTVSADADSSAQDTASATDVTDDSASAADNDVSASAEGDASANADAAANAGGGQVADLVDQVAKAVTAQISEVLKAKLDLLETKLRAETERRLEELQAETKVEKARVADPEITEPAGWNRGDDSGLDIDHVSGGEAEFESFYGSLSDLLPSDKNPSGNGVGDDIMIL